MLMLEEKKTNEVVPAVFLTFYLAAHYLAPGTGRGDSKQSIDASELRQSSECRQAGWLEIEGQSSRV